MALCTPVLIGPVSAWSESLLLEGCVPGAEITVVQGAPGLDVVAKGVATSGTTRLMLEPGIKLSANSKLFAAQRLASETSDWTAQGLALTISAVPTGHAQTAPLSIRSRVFPCSRALWIDGATPGADVVVFAGATELGRRRSREAWARIRLSIPISATATEVTVHQMAPSGFPALSGQPVLASKPVQPLPVKAKKQLPKPSLLSPPAGCRPGFDIGDVIDGAEVSVIVDGATPAQSRIFDLDALTFVLDKRLDADGGTVEVFQSIAPACERSPSATIPWNYVEATTPSRPKPSQPCAGATALHVASIVPGCNVAISFDGKTYDAQAAPTGDEQVFQVPPMPADAKIAVVQSHCGLPSEPGEVTVVAASAASPPEVAAPLHRCARVVRVKKIQPGSFVRVMAKTAYGEVVLSGLTHCPRDTAQIPVSPYLMNGWEVWAEQVACGGLPVASAKLNVLSAPTLPPVTFEPAPISGKKRVRVVAVPGAYVEVFNVAASPRERIGKGHVDPDSNSIWLERALSTSDKLVAVQTLCTKSSKEAKASDVKPGKKTWTLKPKPQSVVVTSEPDGKDFVWKSAKLTAKHDGKFEFIYELENKTTKSFAKGWIDYILKVPNKSPFAFSEDFQMAPKSGPDTPPENDYWMTIYPPVIVRNFSGKNSALQDDEYWLALIEIGDANPDGSKIFSWTVQPMNYPKTKPEEPKPKAFRAPAA